VMVDETNDMKEKINEDLVEMAEQFGAAKVGEIEAALEEAHTGTIKLLNDLWIKSGSEVLDFDQFSECMGEFFLHLETIKSKLPVTTVASTSAEYNKDTMHVLFDKVDTDGSGDIGRQEFDALVGWLIETHAKDAVAAVNEMLKDAPVGYRDFEKNGKKLPFRMGGSCIARRGFELTTGKDKQKGHLLCTVPFDAIHGEVHISLEYQATKRDGQTKELGEGMCIYLVDPKVDEWNTHFEGTGPTGFQGKKGALIGVFVDLAGNIGDDAKRKNSVVIKEVDHGGKVLHCVDFDAPLSTETEGHPKGGEWRNVAIKFDIEHKSCDVTIGTTEVIKDLKLENLHLPKRVCAGVCAGTSKNYRAGFRVNKLVLRGDKA